MAIPRFFCWTRFGTEAAQPIDQILARKEEERIANEGLFLWGIGNAIGPSVKELIRRCANPEVLFSPIKSPPRRKDVEPAAVVAWTSGETLTGDFFRLPEHSLVTSRHDPNSPRAVHYALVCFRSEPLMPARSDEQITLSGLRNLLTGRPIGSSQVTAVVESDGTEPQSDRAYEVAIRAELTFPYFVQLRERMALPRANGCEQDWATIVRRVWEERTVNCES